MRKKPFIRQRVKSFGHAFEGIALFFRSSTHARVHLLATAVVVSIGFWLHIAQHEWLMLLLAIAGVLVSEALNSAIEYTVDLVTEDFHPLAKKAKDVAAGAVLLMALFAVVVGIIIFLPKLLALF